MRDIKHLQSNSEKLAQSNKEKLLFRSQRKAVNAGANGTLEYTIKEGINKKKINKFFINCYNTYQIQ